MQVQRQRPAGGLDGGDEGVGALGRQQAAGILDIDRVHAERREFARLAGVIGVGVDRADRVDDAAGGIETDFLCRAHRHFHVAHVIQRIIGRVIADAVGENSLGRQFDDVVGKELEREQALAARHHDQRCLLDPTAEDAHALPRVFAQVAHTDVEHGAADQIDGFKSGAVEPRGEVGHHRGRHARRPKALVRVAQRHVDQADGSPVAHQ